MIELNEKTKQDFLNREWIQKLLDAGVDMSDAKYEIVKTTDTNKNYIDYAGKFDTDVPKYINGIKVIDRLPTYTVSELLYKLHEWIYLTIDGVEYVGNLSFCKDAPFYIFYYNLKENGKKENTMTGEIYAAYEYPIESLASLLIQCHKRGLGDVGDISNK